MPNTERLSDISRVAIRPFHCCGHLFLVRMTTERRYELAGIGMILVDGATALIAIAVDVLLRLRELGARRWTRPGAAIFSTLP